jgi:hypothetical protein
MQISSKEPLVRVEMPRKSFIVLIDIPIIPQARGQLYTTFGNNSSNRGPEESCCDVGEV